MGERFIMLVSLFLYMFDIFHKKREEVYLEIGLSLTHSYGETME